MTFKDEGLSFAKSLGKILLFLCILPGLVTYLNIQQNLSLSSLESLSSKGVSGKSNFLSNNYHIAEIASDSHSWVPSSTVGKNAYLPERSKNSHWNLIVHKIPATSFFITLNVILAFCYWNYKIQPAAVAKIYANMVTGGEIWRSFSGPTAHFDLWHLALNMMSLSALGKEIEGSRILSSLAFWMYNITFIPLVAGLWIGIQWTIDRLYARNHTTNSDNLHRPTVGYSGVLFAWMVVAALEQQSTCPIIFMPDLCFKTFEVNGFKWSWSPIVQLFVMQLLLPRVSFIGHLAGILAGFFLHWGLLPLKWMHPANAIPTLHLVYLGCFRKVLYMRPMPSSNAELYLVNQLHGLLLCQFLILATSAVIFRPSSSFTFSQLPVTIFWYFYCNERKKSTETSSSTTYLTLTRGFVLCAVLVLITDSMTLAGWIVLKMWSSMTISLLIAKYLVALLAMLLAIASLPKSETGIFYFAFEFTILEPSRILTSHPLCSHFFTGKTYASSAPGNVWAPFGGEGRRLGLGSSQDNATDSPSNEEISQLL